MAQMPTINFLQTTRVNNRPILDFQSKPLWTSKYTLHGRLRSYRYLTEPEVSRRLKAGDLVTLFLHGINLAPPPGPRGFRVRYRCTF